MEKLVWSDKYKVGNPTIDEQHTKIIGLINTLIEHLDDAVNSEIIVDIIGELNQYSYQHLDEEEALLKQVNYPDYEAHLELHMKYRETIAELTMDISLGGNTQVKDFLIFVGQWWSVHIQTEDMKYKAFI